MPERVQPPSAVRTETDEAGCTQANEQTIAANSCGLAREEKFSPRSKFQLLAAAGAPRDRADRRLPPQSRQRRQAPSVGVRVCRAINRARSWEDAVANSAPAVPCLGPRPICDSHTARAHPTHDT